MEVNPTEYLAPTITDYTMSADGRDGAIYVRSKIEPKVIPVFCRLRLSSDLTYEELSRIRREIRGALATDEPQKLILPNDPGIYYMAKCTSADELSSLWANGYCNLEFTCYDPAGYGAEITKNVGASTTINVSGTYRTYPVFDLTAASATRVTVTNYDTGAFVRMAENSAAGAHVVIDMAEETIRQNTNLRDIDPMSDFFPLSPGPNDIRITGATGTCTYIERWR